jgi:hypothetical protein
LKRNLLKSVFRKQEASREASESKTTSTSSKTKKIKHTSSKLSKEEKRRADVMAAQKVALSERAKQLRRLGLPEKQFLDREVKLGTSLKDLGLIKEKSKKKKKKHAAGDNEAEDAEEEEEEEIDEETGLPRYLVKAGHNMRRLL